VGSFELPHPQNNKKVVMAVGVNEAGLYSIILRSDKPEAKQFKRWITHEVLPIIRKTGAFVC
jgi:prophage antirepressor-like protein